MRSLGFLIILLVFQFPGKTIADNSVVNELLQLYQMQGASTPKSERAKSLWVSKFPGKGEFKQRSCSSCHGSDLTQAGKHVKTGKTIQAMNPNVNASRLTEKRKIEKWFKRNCKWTFDRECTVQEKADFLHYLSNPVIF